MSKFVDIEKLIEEKNPKLAKWLPGFVVRYLKRTIHEDETNAFMEKTQDYDTYEFVAEIIDYLIKPTQKEELSDDKKSIFQCCARTIES